MFSKNKLWLVLVPAMMSMVLTLTAFGGTTLGVTNIQPGTYPTVFITPMVTQIVATRPAPTSTPEEEPTPTQTSSGSWDPLAVNIYYPLRGCVASRLRPGDSAFVAYGSAQVAAYPSEDIWFAPQLRRLSPGEAILIVDGPWCYEKTLVWKVRTQVEVEGRKEVFVPEGNGEQYWLLPLQSNPGIATPKPTQVKGTNFLKMYFKFRGCR